MRDPMPKPESLRDGEVALFRAGFGSREARRAWRVALAHFAAKIDATLAAAAALAPAGETKAGTAARLAAEFGVSRARARRAMK